MLFTHFCIKKNCTFFGLGCRGSFFGGCPPNFLQKCMFGIDSNQNDHGEPKFCINFSKKNKILDFWHFWYPFLGIFWKFLIFENWHVGCQFQLNWPFWVRLWSYFWEKVKIVDFRNFLSSKSEKIGFFEQFLVIFSMKEASNQKMVLENVVQNFMMNMILKK